MASDGPSLRDNLDHLLGVARRSLKFLWIGAVIAAVGGTATIAFAMNRSRSYVSETVILYREIIPTNMIRAPGATSSNRSLSIRFREVLFSRPLLEKAVNENELYPEMVGKGDIDEAIELVRDAIKFRERGGNTFRISYQGRTPLEAQKVTASLAELLLQWEKDIQLEAVTITREFFTAERERADLELSGAEYVLAQFLAEHPEFALETKQPGQSGGGSTVGASIRAKQIADGDNTPKPIAVSRGRVSSPELRALERQRDRLNQRLGQLAVQPRTRADRAPPALEKARRDYQRALETLADLKSRFTDRHPDVIRGRARVSAAESLVDSLEAENAKPATPDVDPAERNKLTKQLAAVDKQIAEMRRKLRAYAAANRPKTPAKKEDDGAAYVVELEAEYARLTRQVSELRDRYRTIESKWHTSELSAASEIARQGTQLTVIDPAYKPMRPAGAPTKLVVAFGGMASLGLGLVVVLALGSLDDRIFSATDLAQLDSGAIHIVIPKLDKAAARLERG